MRFKITSRRSPSRAKSGALDLAADSVAALAAAVDLAEAAAMAATATTEVAIGVVLTIVRPADPGVKKALPKAFPVAKTGK